MNMISQNISPSATHLIQADHSKVMVAFHKYHADTNPGTKRALVNTICLLLEIHAQLEEEIFYPAVGAIDPGMVEKNVPEHDEMRGLISQLRQMEPTSSNYDDTLMKLMRSVIHHVADEETTLLPDAEQRLGQARVSELGSQMNKRKLELMMPHAGEIAMNAARAMPASTMLMSAGALLAGSYLLRHALRR
jgi:hypothetical protein